MVNPFSLGAWQKEWKEGDRAIARQLAENYVDDNRAALEARFGTLTLEQCVKLVDMFRETGDEENRLTVEVWLMSEFPPQNIGGKAEIVRRGQRRG